MEEGKNSKSVSKLEDILDTGKNVMEILAAGASIFVGVVTIVKCSKALSLKSSNKTEYWDNKRESDLRVGKSICNSIDRLTESITKIK